MKETNLFLELLNGFKKFTKFASPLFRKSEGGVNYKFIFRLESNQSKGMQSTLSSIELFPFLSTINSKFLPLLPQPRKFCDLRRRLGIGSIRQFPLPPAWDLVDRGTGATSEEPIHHTVLRRLLLEYNG